MPPNSWLEIPDSAMKKVAPDMEKFPAVRAVCGPSAVIDAWGGGALDSKRNRLILWGGGHADYYGNELYAFDINKLAWERLNDPFAAPVKDREINADGSPNARHTYGGLAYLSDADRFFGQGGSLAGVGFAKCELTWTFDFNSKKWENRQPAGQLPGGGLGVCTAYDPASKRLFYGNGKGFFSYDYAANRWSKETDDQFYYQTLTLDSRRHRLIGAGNKSLFTYDLTQPRLRRESLKTQGAEPLIAAGNPGLDYDAVSDRIVGWFDGRVYVLDPDNLTWTVHAPAGAPRGTQNGTYGRWRYVSVVDAFVLVTAWDRNVFFYKPG